MGRSYRRIFDLDFDAGSMQSVTIIDSLITAARAFAESDPDGFAAFTESEKNQEVMAPHIVLSSGLEVIARSRPNFVMDYLLADERRLSLGTSGDHWTETTVGLIAAAYSGASSDLQRQLDRAILSLNRYAGRPFDEEKEDCRAAWNREHQLLLLQAIPSECLEPAVAARREELAREFASPGKRGPIISGGIVGPRVTADELETQSEDEWITLFDAITDADTESFHHRQHDIEITRSGGVHVQANALTEAVSKHPERGRPLLARLRPEAHQQYAVAVVEALGKSISAHELMTLVKDLDARGFRSNDFRARAAGVIEDVARRSGGLTDEDVELLRRWLDEYPTADDSAYEHDRQTDRPRPIITNHWGMGMSHGIPHRLQIMCAIAAGLLARSAQATTQWLSVVEQEIDRETSATFWWSTLRATIPAINARPKEVNQLLGKLFEKEPLLLKDVRMLWLVGRFVPRLEQERLRAWLQPLHSAEPFALRQAYGELVTLIELWHGPAWTALQIERAIADRDYAVLTGIGFVSRRLWSVFRMRHVFAQVLSTIAEEVPRCRSAAVEDFMNDVAEEPLDSDTEAVIHAILANPDCARNMLEPLAQVAETTAGKAPFLSADIVRRILELVGGELRGSALQMRIAGELTSAALTLHRQTAPALRAEGLRLFERLIELDIREADAALEILDRRPTHLLFRYPQRRRYRRSARRLRQARGRS